MIGRSSFRSGGFTLIEAVITMIVVGVLATIGATVMSGGFRTYFLGREIAQDDAQGRLALERMSRELRAVRSTADLDISVQNQVSFTDLSGTASAIDSMPRLKSNGRRVAWPALTNRSPTTSARSPSPTFITTA